MSLALALALPPTAALPIRTKPRGGEHVDSYIRRLAGANHIPPSVLIEILSGRIGYSAAVLRLDLLAILSGRSELVLRHALHGLPKTRGQQLPPSSPSRPSPQRRRRTRADLRATFVAICHDAAHEDGVTVAELARRHHVQPKTVERVLNDPDAQPRPDSPHAAAQRRISRSHSELLERLAPIIDEILRQEPHAPARRIWEVLVDDHQADLPYRVVREFVSTRRSTPGTAVRRGAPRRPRSESTNGTTPVPAE